MRTACGEEAVLRCLRDVMNVVTTRVVMEDGEEEEEEEADSIAIATAVEDRDLLLKPMIADVLV